MKYEYIDITIRFVPNYGFLPIIQVGQKNTEDEVYRGEFKATPQEAFDKAIVRFDDLIKGDNNECKES